MSEWIERIRAAREAGDPSLLIDRIPYAVFLGIAIELVDGELRGRLRYSPQLVGDPTIPALHGGTIGALLESTAIFSVIWSARAELLPKTINLTVDYLRSGRPRDTFASAVITKPGRRVMNVRATAWQDDRARPIATADAHFLLVG